MTTKTVTIQARVNPMIKLNAEKVLEQLGLSMAQAINLFLAEIGRTKKVPVTLSLQPNEHWLNEQEESDLAMAMRDIAAGNYVTTANEQELKKALQNAKKGSYVQK